MSKKVAIIGYSFRLPGVDSSNIWQALCEGRNLITAVDSTRWEQDGFLHPIKGHPGSSYTFAAGSLGDISGFDADFFGISPREAACMDPQQRLLLELAWEALEHAGMPPSSLRGTDCGVYIGISTADYAYRLADDLAAVDAFTATGNTMCIAANRLSYLFDLHGPSMAIDTACSSSLVAFHQACRAIATGEAGCALAGGISLHLHPYGFLTFAKASMLSPRGRCSVFDAEADGYVRSEGGGLFLLKDYDQALADGDQILAVVAATAVNTDGRRKTGLTVPSASAQAALIETACRQAGLNPEDIDYFEAHGTGTPIGDPIEVDALGAALGSRRSPDNPLPVGSVKSNLGHLEAAAGVAGLVKALLSLQHRLVPATVGITSLNSTIDFSALNLQVVQENMPLRQQGPVYIGVNSFGFGGANAHVILTNGVQNAPAKPVDLLQRELPLVVTAKDQQALQAVAQAMANLLEQHSQQLYDIAWTALYRRELHPLRAVVYGIDPSQLAVELRAWGTGTESSSVEEGVVLSAPQGPVFVYDGNGSQWEGMGKALLEDPVFYAAVEGIDQHFTQYAGFSLIKELAGQNGGGRYVRTEVAQPALFALQVGITCMLRQLGIEPTAVIGHSVGEIAAAWACGALSLQDAVQVIYQRSRLQGITAGSGQMTAAACNAQDAEEFLTCLSLPSVALAGCNSPNGVSFAGAVDELEQLEYELQQQGIRFKRLDLDYAFHSPAMDGIQAELLEVLLSLKPQQGRIPLYSTVTGAVVNGNQLDAAYWWRNIREPVLFEQGIAALLADGMNLFISVTPQPILRGYLRESLQSHGVEGVVIATLQREHATAQQVQKAAARAIAAGATFAGKVLFPEPGRLVALPAYPWQRESYWHPMTTESQGLLARKLVHPLLGYLLRQKEQSWERQLDTALLPMLADHVIGGATVYPATGYLETALAAATALKAGAIELEQLEIRAPMLLESGTTRVVRTRYDAATSLLTINSRYLLHEGAFSAHAVVRIVPDWHGTGWDQASCVLPTRAPDFDTCSHALLTQQAGLCYGPAFQTIACGWVEGNRALARLSTPAEISNNLDVYHLHPTFIDNAFQLILQIVKDEGAIYKGLNYLPVSIGQVRYLPGHGTPGFVATTLTSRSAHSLNADVVVYTELGVPVAQIRQVRFKQVRLQRKNTDNISLLDYHRIPAPLPTQQPRLPRKLADHAAESIARMAVVTFSDPFLTTFSNELEPLLEMLCCSFIAEAIQTAVASGMQVAGVKNSPWLQHLVSLTKINGLLDTAGGSTELRAASELLPAQLLWQELIHLYPHQATLIHQIGRSGLQLASYLTGDVPQLEREMLLPTLLPQILGTNGRQSIGAELNRLVSALQADLPYGERLRVLEISREEPLWLASLCAGLDAERAECYAISCSVAAEEVTALLAERCPVVKLYTLADLQGLRAGSIQLAVVTAEFDNLQQAAQALQAAATAVASGGILLLVGFHPLGWADLLGNGRQLWQLSQEGWISLLDQCGFGKISQQSPTVGGTVGPWFLSAVRLQQAVAESTKEKVSLKNLLITGAGTALVGNMALQLVNLLQQQGVETAMLPLDSEQCVSETFREQFAYASTQGIIFVSGLAQQDDGKRVEQLAATCNAASRLALAVEQLHLRLPVWLVTSGSAADTNSLFDHGITLSAIADAPLWAFGRTMMNEYATVDLRLVCLEGGLTPQAFEALLHDLQHSDGEQEVILTADGERFVPRLVIEPSLEVHQSTQFNPDQALLRLGFEMPGQLKNLRWEQYPRNPLQPDQVEVEVRATGLNFRDIMYTLGLLPDEAVENGFAGATLGLEFSGLVSRVGEQVENFKPGDQVVGFGPASFATRTVTTAAALAPIPAGLSFEAAATIPAAFFTTWYALCHQGRLQPGEKVLIHGAAGGVGLAAIQIARHIGAEIHATAGSEAKRDFLRLLGVQHIYDSRTLAFADQILAATSGSGVDLVLNSLAGEAINRNLRVLKPFGRFLELGKRDFYENTLIGLRPFRNNISYFGIDADQIMLLQPELTHSLFSRIMELFEQGVLHPLPFTAFEAEQVVEAFRYMQQARQIGKVVVTYTQGISIFHADPAVPRQLFLDPASTWLITGGLGGFGLQTARWLAERGVRHLVLVGRSGAATPEAQQAVLQLQQQGVQVIAAACDVSNREAVAALLDDLQRKLPPLKGIIHAATAIEDGLLRGMDTAQLERVLAPKMLGARHLHELTAHSPLDYFVLFSSATTLFGNPGQGNYVAANAWLEALARLRRANGLPATVVRWGAIDDVGFLARNQQIKEALQGRMGGKALQSQTALTLLEQLLLHDLSGLGVMELDWSALRRFLPSAGHCRFQLFSSRFNADTSDENQHDLHQLLAELPRHELQELLIGMLKHEVGQILRMQSEKVPSATSLYDLGLDSLMAVELVSALELRFGVVLPVMALSQTPTLEKLADYLITQLSEEQQPGQPADERLQTAHYLALQHGEQFTEQELRELTAADSLEVDRNQRIID